MEIQVKGWKAAVILAVFAGVAIGYRVYLHRDLQVNPEIRESIEVAVTAKIFREVTPALKEALEKGDEKTMNAIGSRIAQVNVDITDLAMRGGDEEIVVRARYTLSGSEGTEEKTGYFLCTHSPMIGWACQYEVSVWRWYIELF